MELAIGAQVTPSVRLERPLGSGGMASVWVGRHSGLDSEVAVKFLRGPYASDENMRARFAREAMAATRVKSAHVVKVHDAGLTDTGTPYIVMELLEGIDLSKRIAEGPLDRSTVLAITTQLCKALERAHEVGIVHRDVKPENVFLCEEGGDLFVKLLDFGIAKTESVVLTESSRRSTSATELLGTPYYMSPEQMRSAKQIDFRTDLWSVGVVVYEMLTGVLPFEAQSLSALAIVVNDCQPKPPSEVDPTLPAAFDAWFATACAHEPADRFTSARELGAELARALAPDADARIAPHAPAIRRSSDARVAREAATLDGGAVSASANVDDIALSETAAPSVSHASPPKKRTATPMIAGGIALAGLFAFAIVRFRSGAAPAAPPPTASELVSTSVPSTSMPTMPTTTTAATPTASASIATIHAVATGGTPSRVRPAGSASAAASASGRKAEDIW